MARYNVRDLIGHFVKPRSAEGKMCPHACCRGYRVHPANYPVILPSKLLHRASDDDLAYQYEHASGEKARAQVLHEMDRRDRAEVERQARRQTYQRSLFARRMERAEAVEYAYTAAEDATRGHLVNRAGRAADVDPRSLFTGPESRARRYASEELLNHWQDHPRPTAAMFAGRDTRIGERYTAPKRKQYGVTRRAAIGSRRHPVEVAVVRRKAS